MPKGKPHLYKEGGLIDSLRAKHDPHYKLASKVAGLQDSGEQVDKLGKEIGIKIEDIHKTLSKSFGMQRKTLVRVAGLEGRVKNIETGVEIWTNREADRSKNQQQQISNLTDLIIQALGDIRSGKAGKAGKDGAAGASGSVGDWGDEVSGDWDATSGSGGRDGLDGDAGLDGFDGASGDVGDAGDAGLDGFDGASGDAGLDGDGFDGADGVGGINGDTFLGAENYEKYADELQQQGTIAGQQVSPQERKEGFKKRNNKIGFQKFVTKVLNKKGKKGKNGKSGTSGSAGGFGPAGSTGKNGASSAAADVEGVSKGVGDEDEDGVEEKEPAIKEITNFLKNALDPALIKIEENLDKILGHLEGRVEADKDKADDIKQDVDAAADDAREKELEKKGGSKIVGPAFDKAIKPVKGFLDMILKFFMNVILGSVVMRLVDIIQNPKKLLDPLFLIVNGISTVLNQIIKAIWFIGTAPTRLLKNALEFGLNNMISVINLALGALKSLGVDFSIPEVDFPDIPQAPQIPMIPLASAQDAGSAPAVAMAGGGLVPGEKGDTGEKGATGEKGGYWEGRGDTSHFGTTGYRMGQVLPEQLIYNFDKFTSSSTEVGGKIVDEKEELIELGGSIGMPDLIEHQTQLVESLRKEKGYEDVNFMDVVQYPQDRGKLVSMPKEKLYPIFNASDAWKASDAKRDAAMKLDDENNLLFLDPSKVAEKVGGFNKGGQVPGKGEGDTVPAMLTPGEFVMSKGAVDQIGVQNLMAMNKAGGGTNKPKLMKFAGGGSVPDAPGPRRKGGVTIVGGTGGAGGGGASSSSGGDQSSVSAFSARDMRNEGMLLIKSIYNIAG